MVKGAIEGTTLKEHLHPLKDKGRGLLRQMYHPLHREISGPWVCSNWVSHLCSLAPSNLPAATMATEPTALSCYGDSPQEVGLELEGTLKVKAPKSRMRSIGTAAA
ncbi:tlr1247 [Thermosynechococcus vestitus BP-1]|uniref:Tlr1247 protein n=1 Tax=Thermosynechococcus vestitus (strain NIES-2133 / IAM M-273 / BP-1) TaxID=197221 RepID=Q8DJH8_THEVB|nr:tlr1247 [Thermosynechococcus vestitus BP-1]